MNIIIEKLTKTDKIPYHILLLADPSSENIEKYIHESELYVAKDRGEEVACYVLSKRNNNLAEIKNIAVEELFQGKGIGFLLLSDAISRARFAGFNQLIIGTGNSSIKQLYLYQKAGFRISEIVKDFFTNNYSEPIYENGLVCRDMVLLIKDL